MATIFAADENALVVDLMSIFLSEEGHHFLSADGLIGLLELLKTQDEKPDLLILSADLEPGFLSEVIFELRGAIGEVTPILVTLPTGAAHSPHEIQGIAGVDLLRKPFDSDTFMKQIRELLSAGDPWADREPITPGAPIPAAKTPVEQTRGAQDSPEAQDSPPTGQPRDLGSMGLTGLSTAALNEQIRVWLADEGRLIMEHEARRALEETYAKVVEEIAWKVIPEMAEEMLRVEIRRLTAELEN